MTPDRIYPEARQNVNMSSGQIEQAKQEWEATVDVLPELVCLLDRQGNILRANRTVERWELGQVADVKNTSLHDLLHPVCTLQNCYLKTFWQRVAREVEAGHADNYEQDDRLLKRYLRYEVRPLDKTAGKTLQGPFAVLILHNISRYKQSEKALQASEPCGNGVRTARTAPASVVDFEPAPSGHHDYRSR